MVVFLSFGNIMLFPVPKTNGDQSLAGSQWTLQDVKHGIWKSLIGLVHNVPRHK